MTDYKIGQKIVINMRSGNLGIDSYPPYKIEKITKVTPTQITTSDGRRYMKSTRHEVGNRWHGYSIAFNYFNNYGLMTEEEALKANEIALMRQFLGTTSWKSVPAVKIEQIYKILKGEDK